ncbi:MAG: thiamine-phosphate kinase [Rhodospirillales bacterium]
MASAARRGEFETIARYFAPLADSPAALGLGNDAAVLAPPAGRDLVLTADAMIAGVHFLPDDPPETVGRKLLRVNLSDLAAMGAAPLGYLLTCAWPRDVEEAWIAAFAAGLAEDQARFAIQLLGGDTTSGPGPLSLSLTALGSVAPGRALPRSGAKAGDEVLVSGTIGDGALGLLARQGRLSGLSPENERYLTARYRLPEPRLALGRALAEAGLATACLDVSDGLVADLGHIAETSGLGAEIEAAAVPLSAAAQEVVADDLARFPLLLSGGDDYELCFTVAPGSLEAVLAAAERAEMAVSRIGRMVPGEGVRVLDRDRQPLTLDRGGWQHF